MEVAEASGSWRKGNGRRLECPLTPSDWNLSSCRPAATPLPSSGVPSVAPPNAIPDVSDTDLLPKYQRLVGCLLYLAVSTRPDIAYVSMWLVMFWLWLGLCKGDCRVGSG